MNDKATSYFKELSKLLLSVQVRDQHNSVVSLDEGGAKATEMILSVKTASCKVMLIGNGGSAAIASHMQNDLCKTVGVRATVFNEAPLLTALANDGGYECAYEHLVDLWANADDLLIAISSSGQSENIVRAVQVSVRRKCQVITLSGFSPDNPLRRMGHLNFYVDSEAYGNVELVHSALAHFLTDRAGMSNVENQNSQG